MGKAGKFGNSNDYLLEALQGFISVFDVFGVFSRTRAFHIEKYQFLEVQDAFHYDLNAITLDLKEVMGTYSNRPYVEQKEIKQ